MPREWEAPLAAAGWTYEASNQGVVFWEKPGYWLRLSYYSGGWYASVLPENFHVGFERGEFADHEKAKPYLGRGAHQRALEGAAALWLACEAHLEPLGIQLDCVGVRRHRSSSGSGSSIGTVSYRRHQLEALLKAMSELA